MVSNPDFEPRLCLTQYADDSTYTVGSRRRQENQINIGEIWDELKVFLHGQPPSLVVEKELGVQKVIEDSTYTRILGANEQSNIAWQAHLKTGYKALLPQVRRQLGPLKQQGRLIPESSRRNLARRLICSRLNYLLPL